MTSRIRGWVAVSCITLIGILAAPAAAQDREIIKEDCKCDVTIKTGKAVMKAYDQTTLSGTYTVSTPKRSKGGRVSFTLTMVRSYKVKFMAKSRVETKVAIGVPTVLPTNADFVFHRAVCPAVTLSYSFDEFTDLTGRKGRLQKGVLTQLQKQENTKTIGVRTISIIRRGDRIGTLDISRRSEVELVLKIELVCGQGGEASGGQNADTAIPNFLLVPDTQGNATATFG